MAIAPFSTVSAWLDEIQRRESRFMRAATAIYERYDRVALQLTPARIRASADAHALAVLEGVLRRARQPGSFQRLNHIWSRADLGDLIVAAEGRRRQLELGRFAPRVKGPTLDPRRLPDDRLEALIQRHRDLATVEALRAERRRRGRLQEAA